MRSARGSAAVEFALVVPVLMLAIMAAVEVVVVARTQLEVVNSAREGAREAATSPDPQRAVEAARAPLGPRGPDARVSVVRPDHVGGSAVVTVRLPHRVAGGLLGGYTIELSARAAMRVER